MIYRKIIEWIKRYLPAEICAIIGAITGGLTIHFLFTNPYLTALGGTWGENIGYYGKIVYQDLKQRTKQDRKLSIIGILKTIRNLIVEFGPSEYIDSFIIRPVMMYIFPQIIKNVFIGLFIGKLVADITFYIPTIISYEFRKKVFKD